MMTVGELIERLRTLDPTLPVVSHDADNDAYYHVNDVDVRDTNGEKFYDGGFWNPVSSPSATHMVVF